MTKAIITVTEAKVIDIIDQYNNMKFPKITYLNRKPFIGNAFVVNGYNGYTSSKDDGYILDSKTKKPLTDKGGNILTAKERRGLNFTFTNNKNITL